MVFEDNTSWRKFISSSKAFQDGTTLEKERNFLKFTPRLLHVPMHVQPCAPALFCEKNAVLA